MVFNFRLRERGRKRGRREERGERCCFINNSLLALRVRRGLCRLLRGKSAAV